MSSSSSATTSSSLKKMKKEFHERADFEQYFWREEMLEKIMINLSKFYHQECIYNGLHKEQEKEERRNQIPKFRYYTLTIPSSTKEEEKEDFQIIILDPPHCYYCTRPIENCLKWLYNDICKIVNGNFQAKICIHFSKRNHSLAMKQFGIFGLKQTTFELDYNWKYYKPNKWENFYLYSNFNLPGIKQIKK